MKRELKHASISENETEYMTKCFSYIDAKEEKNVMFLLFMHNILS